MSGNLLRNIFQYLLRQHQTEINRCIKEYRAWKREVSVGVTATFIEAFVKEKKKPIGSVGNIWQDKIKTTSLPFAAQRVGAVLSSLRNNQLNNVAYNALVRALVPVRGKNAKPYANRIACVFDDRLGWIVTDKDLKKLIDMLEQNNLLRVSASGTWFQKNIALTAAMDAALSGLKGYNPLSRNCLLWRLRDSLTAHDEATNEEVARIISSAEIMDKNLGRDKEAQSKIRIGQSEFRLRLKAMWGGCAVTGVSNDRLWRASHAKPWAKCKGSSQRRDRLSPYNGLPLSPNYDALFDSGLITFDFPSGKIRISQCIDEKDLAALKINTSARLRRPERKKGQDPLDKEHQQYLDWHRKHVFKKKDE